MNKFTIAVLLAFVAVAAANPTPFDDDLETESQLSIKPTDDEETAGLDGITQVYGSFCLEARDAVINDGRSRINNFASNIFGIFFNSAEQLGLEAVNVQKEATDKISAQIRDPSAPIEEYDQDSEVQSIIAEGQKAIQESTNQPMSLFSGVVATLAATKNAVTSHVLTRLSQMRDAFGPNTIANALKGACQRVEEYDQLINQMFDEAKAQAIASNPAADVGLESVKCLTVRRLIRLDGICKTVMAVQSPLIKAVTYKPIAQ